MIEPLKLALLCESAYAEKPADGWEAVWNVGGTVAAFARVDGHRVIVFRGSLTLVDWLRNIEAAPLLDDQLGYVHPGFMAGVRDVLVAHSLIGNTAGDLVVCGHSLGGARARLFAGLCVINGIPLAQCTTFGAPKPAFGNLRRVLEKGGVALSSFRNRLDPVPIVPTLLPWWEHTDQWVALDAPAPSTDLMPFRDHRIKLYQSGLQKLAATNVPLPAAA